MTPREKRRFKRQFDAQVERERNGEPIDPETAARMTRPKMADILYQVMVTKRGSTDLIPFGPMMIKDAAGMFAEAINQQILLGREKLLAKAEVAQMTLMQSGVN